MVIMMIPIASIVVVSYNNLFLAEKQNKDMRLQGPRSTGSILIFQIILKCSCEGKFSSNFVLTFKAKKNYIKNENKKKEK